MVIALSLALALQAAPAGAGTLSCSLVTPSAEAVDLAVVESRSGVLIVPRAGSIWPSAPLQTRQSRVDAREFIVGGRDGLVLDTERVEGSAGAIALLSRRSGGRVAYPVAVGVCRAASTAADGSDPLPAAPSSHADDLAAFDPRRWPTDCGLLLDDGRRVRFDYAIDGPKGQVRIESAALWGNRPIITRWIGVSGGINRFGGRSGPAGSERLLGRDNIRVKIIHFRRIGDPAVTPETGLGICGYSNIIRVPAR